MMTRLMTWFIELWNEFNELRLFKISMIYVLNWVDDLTSWQSRFSFIALANSNAMINVVNINFDKVSCMSKAIQRFKQ